MAHSTSDASLGQAGIDYYYEEEIDESLQEINEEQLSTDILYNNNSLMSNSEASSMSNNSNKFNGNVGSTVRIGKIGGLSQLVNQSNNAKSSTEGIQNKLNGTNVGFINIGGAQRVGQRIFNVPSAENNEWYNTFPQQQQARAKPKIHAIQSAAQNTSLVQKRRKADKTGNGLRHFSMKVCEKVKEKGNTTYNEVADELVNEKMNQPSNDNQCDQKNIRRRVYDALNVLMAMHIISKDKKEIRWIGLPTNSIEQCVELEKENAERRERIQEKHKHLRSLLLQHVAFKSLLERNKDAEKRGLVPIANGFVQLPFIIVNTKKETDIHCNVTNDKSEYYFKFGQKFQLHDDMEILTRMGLLFGLDKGECSPEDLEKVKALLPRPARKYLEQYNRLQQNENRGECDLVESIIQQDSGETIGATTEINIEDFIQDDNEQVEYCDFD